MKKTIEEQCEIAVSKLGVNGHIMSWSKSGYLTRFPDNIAVFNSNICTDDGKIWFGDIDVTESKYTLIELAKELNQDVYVLYEMDGRFDNEDKPLLHKYVVKFTTDGMMMKNKLWS